MTKIFIMKHSTKSFFQHILAALLVLFCVTQNAFSQLGPATITNSNPSDAAILNALNGGGMTIFLDTGDGDGLVTGVRNEQVAIFSGGDRSEERRVGKECRS